MRIVTLHNRGSSPLVITPPTLSSLTLDAQASVRAKYDVALLYLEEAKAQGLFVEMEEEGRLLATSSLLQSAPSLAVLAKEDEPDVEGAAALDAAAPSKRPRRKTR